MVEIAQNKAVEKLEEASAFLEEVKKKSGKCYGTFWWMEREIEEAQKYLPTLLQRK